MPDAFSKTVPIWVAVMNRALFPGVPESHVFQRPPAPYELGESEVSQIVGKLEGFVEALKLLELDMEKLRQEVGRPMKLFWRVNDSTRFNRALRHEARSESAWLNHHPVILCSASRRVVGAEMSEGAYIQGAGDDSEGWSHGLTPALFWQHKDRLCDTPSSKLESLIRTLIVNAQKDYKSTAAVRIAPTSNLYVSKAAVDDPTALVQAEQKTKTMSGNGLSAGLAGQETEAKFDFVINCNKADASMQVGVGLDLACRTGKLGSRDLREKLGLVRDFVQVRLKRHPGASIVVTCETGKDLCIGVALMLLCHFYDDGGHFMLNSDEANGKHDRSSVIKPMDKSFIRTRLAWIVASDSDASPSRTTLQSVNAFLIERAS